MGPTMQASEGDVSIVKVLRGKCNDLEDQLDAEIEGKEAALATKAQLAQELEGLRQELRAEREASQLAGILAGKGREVVESLQEAVSKQKLRCESVQRSCEEQTQLWVELKAAQETAHRADTEREETSRRAEQAAEDHRAAVAGVTDELEAAQQQRSKLSNELEEVTECLSDLEDVKESFQRRLATFATMKRDLQERETSFSKLRLEQAEHLQAELAAEEEQRSDCQQRAEGLEEARQGLEERLRSLEVSGEALREKLERAERELQASLAAGEADAEAAARAEEELARRRKCLESLQEQCSESASDRNQVLECLQAAERGQGDWEAELEAAGERLSALQRALREQGEDEAAPLQAALSEEQQHREEFQRIHEELGSRRDALVEQLREMEAAGTRLQGALRGMEAELQGTEAGGQGSGEHAERGRSELLEVRRCLEEADEDSGRLLAAREGARQRLEESELARRREEQCTVELAERLEAELRSRVTEAECHHELQQQHDESAQAREAEEQRADALASQLQAERLGRAEDADGGAELQELCDALCRELEDHRLEANTLESELQEESALRVQEAGVHEELRGSLQELTASVALTRQRLQALAEEHEGEIRLCAADRDACATLLERCERLAAEHTASADTCAAAQADLERAAEAHGEERQRRGELQERLDAVQPEHEDLFTRYSAAVEQIDILKTENRQVARERDGLRITLEESREEEERVRKEREEVEPPRPPPPITVSDVLISVVFDDVAAPLELRPWDTDLDAVVERWLAAEQRGRELLPSIVRYLRQLEETAEAFPVRAEANLSEVHEEFAM